MVISVTRFVIRDPSTNGYDCLYIASQVLYTWFTYYCVLLGLCRSTDVKCEQNGEIENNISEYTWIARLRHYTEFLNQVCADIIGHGDMTQNIINKQMGLKLSQQHMHDQI